jgi:hypothetical protein
MKNGPLRRLAPALTVLACLLAAPPAMGATAAVDADQDRLELSASNGERNVITVTGSGSTYTLEDTVSNISAGTGCTQLAAKKVRCSSIHNGPIASVYLDLRDQDDTVVDSASIDVEVSAGDGNDKLTGGADRDKLYGGPGNDLLDGGFGADLLVGDAGIDRVTYAARTAPVNVSIGSYWGDGGDGQYGEWDYVSSTVEEVVGGSADDKLTGNSGVNTLLGGPGNDALAGLDGNDVLEGGDGTDNFDAGNGDDTLLSRDASADAVVCGAGTDAVDVDSADTVAPDCERPAAVPSAPAAAILNAVPSTVRLTSKGDIRIRVTCPVTAVFGCTGSITVAVLPVAKASAMAYRAAAAKAAPFSLKAGETKVTKVKISRNGRRRVLAKKRAKCKVSVHTTNAGTKRVTVSKNVTVKAPMKGKKQHTRSR